MFVIHADVNIVHRKDCKDILKKSMLTCYLLTCKTKLIQYNHILVYIYTNRQHILQLHITTTTEYKQTGWAEGNHNIVYPPPFTHTCLNTYSGHLDRNIAICLSNKVFHESISIQNTLNLMTLLILGIFSSTLKTAMYGSSYRRIISSQKWYFKIWILNRYKQ